MSTFSRAVPRVAVFMTSKGIMSDRDARRMRVGVKSYAESGPGKL